MQILKNIYKLTGEEYGMIPNIYAIKTQSGLILVDCGTDKTDWNVAEESMRYWELDSIPITHVLITHAHGDHAGFAAELQRRGAKIICGKNAVAVESAEDPRNFYYAYRNPFEPFIPDRYVQDEEDFTINGLRFIAYETPGHSVGDIVYKTEMYNKVIMFIGDVFHIAEYGKGAWIGNQWFLDSDYDCYMRSLYRLKEMKADVLLSGHMQGCLGNGTSILKDAFTKSLELFEGKWDKKAFLQELNIKLGALSNSIII